MPSRSLRSEKLDLQLTRKAQTALRPPRRGKAEAELVRRFVFWWFTGRDRNKPSGRDWARQLGISHIWLQKLVREFESDADEM